MTGKKGKNMNRCELLQRLEPYALGAFSGNVADWPQLKPLLKDIYEYLQNDSGVDEGTFETLQGMTGLSR